MKTEFNDRCENCGATYGLHQFETNQCPAGGFEAPVGQMQSWAATTFLKSPLTTKQEEYPQANDVEELDPEVWAQNHEDHWSDDWDILNFQIMEFAKAFHEVMSWKQLERDYPLDVDQLIEGLTQQKDFKLGATISFSEVKYILKSFKKIQSLKQANAGLISIDDAAHFFRMAMNEATTYDDEQDAQNYILDIVSRFRELINQKQ